LNVSTLLALIGNLIPLAGLYYWHWDPFQLLMLYWMETVIVAGWALLHLGTLPDNQLGRMTVNGKDQPATRRDLLSLFGGMAAAFCLAQFFFLWMIFQDGWRGKVHGPASFVRVFVIESGAWVPLLFAFLSGLVAFVMAQPSKIASAPQRGEASDGVGAAVGGMLGRIVIMQCAVIFGAMLAHYYGSNAPMYIVIGLKLLSDLRGKPLRGVTITTESGSGKNATIQTIKLPDDTSPS